MKIKNLQLILIAFITFNLQFLSQKTIAQVSFSPLTNFSCGPGPISITNADFNGDSKTDLAIAAGQANVGGNSVSVLLGDGLGGFATAINFGNTVLSNFITSADFNQDNIVDLATTDANQNSVSVFIGIGNGTFNSALSFSLIGDSSGITGNTPISLISADFNLDGNADLATANAGGSGSVSVLLGDGTGNFNSVNTFTAGWAPYSIVSADFNADGNADLAVACQDISNNVAIFLGNGSGGFSSATYSTIGGYPHTIITNDFNGDSKPDLAIGYQYNTNKKVVVLLGNGTGGFSAATPSTVSSDPYSLTSTDFNFDGKIDLAVTLRYGGSVSVLIGNGMGNFGTPTEFTVGLDPWGIINADFDSDGKSDLAVTNYTSNNVSILLNNTTPPISPICIVSVDSTLTHNIIVWEKTNLNMAVIDSFIVYREITTNNYQPIGVVSSDSLSTFDDFSANPSTTGYRYKIKSKNVQGLESPLSDYHNTIYLSNTGANFNWTPYQIENNTTPVSTYSVFRDNNSTGNFVLIGNTTGNQFGYTDVNFSSFPNASYYVEAVMTAGSCSPTRNGFTASRSNMKNFGTVGIQQLNNFTSINIYPNPTDNSLNISGITGRTMLRLYDVVGKLVLEKEVESNTILNTSQLAEGVYTLLTESKMGRSFNKVVISR